MRSCFFLSSDIMNHYPHHPCMVYLPTFTIQINQMEVNIPCGMGYDTMSMTVNERHRHRCHPTEQYTLRFATSNWSRFIQVPHKKAVFGKNRCKFTYTNTAKSVLTKKNRLFGFTGISIQMYTYLFTCCMNVK